MERTFPYNPVSEDFPLFGLRPIRYHDNLGIPPSFKGRVGDKSENRSSFFPSLDQGRSSSDLNRLLFPLESFLWLDEK